MMLLVLDDAAGHRICDYLMCSDYLIIDYDYLIIDYDYLIIDYDYCVRSHNRYTDRIDG